MNKPVWLLALAAGAAAMMCSACSPSSARAAKRVPSPSAPGSHPGVQVQFNLPVPMRDGVRLRADVYTPDGKGPFPVLLKRTPYDKLLPQKIHDGIEGAEHGFIVVIEDVRGRFASPGTFTPFRYESRDGYDSVEWAARLPKSDGEVGMWGGSYVGATQWLAAIADPPHLAGIAPQVTPGDYYADWAYTSGALQQWFLQTWVMDLAQNRLDRELLSRTSPAQFPSVLPLGGYTPCVSRRPWAGRAWKRSLPGISPG